MPMFNSGIKLLKRKKNRHTIDNIQYLIMVFPAVFLFFIFNYLPIGGIVIAFKRFRFDKGIFGSDWAGFDNFKFFFQSQDAWRVTRNTLGMNFLFIVAGLILSVSFAIMLYELRSRVKVKVYQTIMLLPHFLSWVVVGYISYSFFNPHYGLLNGILLGLGLDQVNVYMEPSYWPFILTGFNVWKHTGMSLLIYYATLMGMDREYLEAARIDGATKLQMIRKIIIPYLVPVMIIIFILALGRIFRADFGLFYEIPRGVPVLYKTTDVIDTYVFRALRQYSDIGMSAAVGLYQSVVGFFTILGANWLVRRIQPESSLF